MAKVTPLMRAIAIKGGLTRLAEAMNTTPQVIYNWKRRQQVPPEKCGAIELATGGIVSREELRPDVFGKIE